LRRKIIARCVRLDLDLLQHNDFRLFKFEINFDGQSPSKSVCQTARTRDFRRGQRD
jgi:hypothetical protein